MDKFFLFIWKTVLLDSLSQLNMFRDSLKSTKFVLTFFKYDFYSVKYFNVKKIYIEIFHKSFK